MDTLAERNQAAKKVTIFGMFINIFLVILKLVLGILGASSALVADAIHSLSDFITDIVVLVGSHFTAKPADDKHNYGHGKIETVTTVVIGVLLMAVAIFLLVESSLKIFRFFFIRGTLEVPAWYTLIAVILSIVLKEMLYRITVKVGKNIKSEAVIANAWHHRSDAFSSVAAFIGILLAFSFGEKLVVCDPIASFVVSLFILKVGVDITKGSASQLIDASINPEEIKRVKEIIESIDGIIAYDDLKTRKIAFYNDIDVIIFVDRNLNIEEAHGISNKLEEKIIDDFGRETLINVHIEPFYEKSEEKA